MATIESLATTIKLFTLIIATKPTILEVDSHHINYTVGEDSNCYANCIPGEGMMPT